MTLNSMSHSPSASPVPRDEEIRALQEEVQHLRKRLLKYAEEADQRAGLDALRTSPFEPLDFQLSKGYRIWKMYLGLYDLPAVGPVLAATRTIVGKAVRLLRRLR